jgi:uroporphyrinogen-III synthase
MTEEKFDELAQQFGGSKELLPELDDEDEEDLFEAPEAPVGRARAPASAGSAREELERRLAESRARRRASGELEEPLA